MLDIGVGRGIEDGHEVQRIDVKPICEKDYRSGQVQSERSTAVLWRWRRWIVRRRCRTEPFLRLTLAGLRVNWDEWQGKS